MAKKKKRELKRQSPWHILGALPQGVSWNPGHDVWACLLVSPLELLAKGQRLQQIFATTSLRSAWGRRVDRIIQSFSQIINHSSESLINSASTIWLWPQTCRRKNTRERPGVFVGSWEWRRSLSGLVLGAGSLAGSCVFVINCYLIRFAWFRGLMGNKTVLGPASPRGFTDVPTAVIHTASASGPGGGGKPIPIPFPLRDIRGTDLICQSSWRLPFRAWPGLIICLLAHPGSQSLCVSLFAIDKCLPGPMFVNDDTSCCQLSGVTWWFVSDKRGPPPWQVKSWGP